jgi:membrane protein
VPKIGNRIFPISALGIASFLTYLLVPANSPCKLSAFQGALLFALCLFGVNITFTLILNHANYNLLYGTLGNLILLLVNVYFFFLFFFIGAQFAYVTDTFDALLFSKIRQTRIPAKMIDNSIPVKTPWDIKLMRKIFNPFEGNLKKYLHFYKKGEVIILKGDVGDDVFYIIDGEAEILLSPDVNETDNLQNSINDKNYSAGVLEAGSFFGEMGYLLSEERCATIKAKTDISVYALPHLLFDSILKYDTNIDIEIIEHMSRRLKDTTKHITSAG